MSKLFEPTRLKLLDLQNRVVVAPMTRARTSQPGNIPNQMVATDYKQHATAGLIISEATKIQTIRRVTHSHQASTLMSKWQAGKLLLKQRKTKAQPCLVSCGMLAVYHTQHSKKANSLMPHQH